MPCVHMFDFSSSEIQAVQHHVIRSCSFIYADKLPMKLSQSDQNEDAKKISFMAIKNNNLYLFIETKKQRTHTEGNNVYYTFSLLYLLNMTSIIRCSRLSNR